MTPNIYFWFTLANRQRAAKQLFMSAEAVNVSSDCEISASRIVNATQETVFRAWTDPEHLKVWWGPAGFTNTFSEFDLRPGGKWRFVMHGPEKGHYPNECEFIKIEKPNLVAWNRISPPLFQVVATFDAIAPDKTRVTFKMVFATAKECGKLKPFVIDKNEENLDRLENELARMQ
jgi:uncharacterized protein YndB with AHSA1/START domain